MTNKTMPIIDISNIAGLSVIETMPWIDTSTKEDATLLSLQPLLERTFGPSPGPPKKAGGLLHKVANRFLGKRKKRISDIDKPKKVPVNQQIKFAKSIIEAGKKNDAKRIKLTVDKDVGASLGASYAGANLKGQVGVDGKFHIEVEYK